MSKMLKDLAELAKHEEYLNEVKKYETCEYVLGIEKVIFEWRVREFLKEHRDCIDADMLAVLQEVTSEG